MRLTLTQLSEQSGVPERSVRFYIQKGLVDRPEGEKRGAYYTPRHLEQLLRIRQWREAGLSLEGIAELLAARSEPPRSTLRPSGMEVRSHLLIADGVELAIAPERAGLSSDQVRQLFRAVQAAYADLARSPSDQENPDHGD
ncbi:helix-turn-helix domain-containing protein [Rehaibacterium terrae]|jgi:DNA-binding transcriptional MerR regulator|uniref:DNA-binding transcriptional MerR regulator n=1 Tax=Rehaibacterium terrae TaxID=1341696 RepID=A0A7W7XZP5_9GAMM|nr:helix-turn-helix domain-containing protein [Rehaibacterium terrae]MBB5015431.1 DNA-binding transcriptional MerR regulator [Rehaibacterium terrae]